MVSQRAANVRPSGIRKMFERVATLRDPIDFSIGQPHFEVPEEIREAAIAAIRAGKNRYTVTQGIPELNARIASSVADRIGRRPEQTLVTAGVSGGLLLSYFALLDPGDAILMPDPYFVLYRVLAELVGARPQYYDLYPDFVLTLEALERSVTDRTRVLLLNSPANPTGAQLGPDELRLAAHFARRHGLTIISDEIYEAFAYDEPARSVAEFHEDVVILGGFSKTYAVPGWRLGFAAGPRHVLDAMSVLQQFTFVCANTPGQHGVLAAFDVDIQPHVDDYRRKRDRIVEALADLYRPVPPRGSFYVFPPLPAGLGGAGFVERALARELLLVPGSACSERDSHFRISFAVPDPVLDRGIRVLRELVQ